jgi:chemotaxis protein methyltransferase WspC
MKAIEDLLRDRIGLDAASIGSSLIERCVRLRMKALGIPDADGYLRRLRVDEPEWRELIESVVVPETWFFRDRQAFDALIQNLVAEWLPRQLLHPLRILSAPCSTGEEPYSLAMALLDAGWLPGQFEIEAIDISVRALAVAQVGVYGRNAFRGQDLDFRDRHFHRSKAGYILAPRVRQCVRFHQLNLLEQDLPGGPQQFDYIFCRNLLIYFDRDTQGRLLRRLRHALSAEGILFVGPAEMPLIADHGFVRENLAMAFACRRADAAPALAGVRAAATRDVAPIPAAAHTDKRRKGQDELPVAAHAARTADDLAHARRLADQGKLDEAHRYCEAHLSQFGPGVEVYCLLGLVADARGDEGAFELYRKAIYLDPNHYESLLHLSFLLEKRGDRAGARAYRRRAERARMEVSTS